MRTQPLLQEDEGPVIESRGRRERIDPSKVPSGIWWFNGATPTLPQLYPNEVDLSTGLPATGRYRYRVSRGADKLALLDGANETSDLTVQDDASPTVRGIGPSDSAGDVELQVTHTPTGSSSASTSNARLQVRAPRRLELLGCSHAAQGALGLETTFQLKVYDNFDAEMPYIDVNEDFTTGSLAPGVSQDWQAALAARTKGSTITLGDAIFHDNYTAVLSGGAPPPGMTPLPHNPQNPLGNSLVATFTHEWNVGSRTTGQGVLVSNHTGRFFSDHGQYFGFWSPPMVPYGTVDCPP